MKVLFVCKANVGRSQVAQVRFEQLSKHESYCAGIGVAESVSQRPSSKMKDIRNLRPVEYIKTRLGVDLSERERLQLTPEMIDDIDLAIMIHDKAEWPDYLNEDSKVVFWDIPDTPGLDDEAAGKLWDQVQLRVEELVQEIG
jgi:protein-tyrosine-phosphatase